MFSRKGDEGLEPLKLFEEAMGMGNYVTDDLLADYCAPDNIINWETKINDEENYKIIINGSEGSTTSESAKKSVHKDNEKKRRQEMAALHASLRSLLPLEYVKGKRAVSDHMEQAVNYIKDMQNKIEEMKMGRNKLVEAAQNPNWNCDCVNVNLLRDGGMEILITISSDDDDENKYCFPLSKVLAFLLGLGLNVTTSLSTTSHQHSFHKLHILQVNEMTSIDISELKQRLVNLIRVA